MLFFASLIINDFLFI